MQSNLHFKTFGSGEPIIILYGLLGGWNNWYPVSKELSQRFGVYVPDLRNHGQSFHSARCDYDAMADDIRRLMEGIGLRRATLLGHSMGGKVAMRFASTFPQRVSRLIIVDITHKACRPIYTEALRWARRPGPGIPQPVEGCRAKAPAGHPRPGRPTVFVEKPESHPRPRELRTY